ncbi:MAG: hypothetical protein K1X29_09325 [Bdellovibrionales bacterium]|nr:hypothetical protein [Bdellovibrionales bacterium]
MGTHLFSNFSSKIYKTKLLCSFILCGTLLHSTSNADFWRGDHDRNHDRGHDFRDGRGWGRGEDRRGRPGDGWGRGPGGHEDRYNMEDTFSGGCLGGSICRNRYLVINLPRQRAIQSVEFYARDNIGNRHEAVVNLYLDNRLIASNIDIKKAGSTHYFSGNNRYAYSIRFEAVVDDESQIEWVTVTYADRR